jgi:hypothetical protein
VEIVCYHFLITTSNKDDIDINLDKFGGIYSHIIFLRKVSPESLSVDVGTNNFYYIKVLSYYLVMAIVILPFLGNRHDCLTRYGLKCEGTLV